MKHLLVIILFLTTHTVSSQEEITTLTWLTNLERAKKLAKKKHKPILLYFTGSDWCSPCKMLKKDFFNSPEFKEKADHLILVMIDLPRRVDILSEKQLIYNKSIVEKYNKEKAFPTIIALDHRGKILEKISGYGLLRDVSIHFAFLDRIIARYK